jgi:hypothetical protein
MTRRALEAYVDAVLRRYWPDPDPEPGALRAVSHGLYVRGEPPERELVVDLAGQYRTGTWVVLSWDGDQAVAREQAYAMSFYPKGDPVVKARGLDAFEYAEHCSTPLRGTLESLDLELLL